MKMSSRLLAFNLILTVIFLHGPSMAQVCTKTTIQDKQLIEVLSEYIVDCHKTNPLYEQIGVIKLFVYPDTNKKEKLYQLALALDDAFKENPPQRYAHLFGKIILIYDYEENRVKQNILNSEQLNALMEEVGDRVFVAQTIRGRWVETYKPNGEIKSRNHVQEIKMGGSPTNIFVSIDKKSGKVTKSESY